MSQITENRWLTPVTLTGTKASLAPLSPDHAADLKEAAADGALHGLWYTTVPHPDQLDADIERRLNLQAAGHMLAFSVMSPEGRAIGMTTYMNIDHSNRRVEIGSTWLRQAVQRSGLNTEVKHMMLRHAFETCGAIAVEFRTHRLNRQSRAAIERLGAQLDGILRSHMISRDGLLRDTAVYSIIQAEWPTIDRHLRHLMSR